LCASVVALMALAVSSESAFAGSDTSIGGVGIGVGKPCRDANGNPCKEAEGRVNSENENATGHDTVTPQDQSTAPNTTRSNIKNN
jgi:hypothetical protein